MKVAYLVRPLICLFILSVPVFSQKLVTDPAFTPAIDKDVNFVKLQSDGKIMIAGDFAVVNGVSRLRIARLNADGTLDMSFDANPLMVINGGAGIASIKSMEVLSDGKILIAGYFGSGLPLDTARPVLRLNSNGSLDSTLTSIPQMSGSGFPNVEKAEQLPNGKILLCGTFTLPNGNAQPRLARYNSNGTFDPTFTTAINSDCRDVKAQPDGKYIVSGFYSTVNGASRVGLTRFNADDSVDTGFNTAQETYRAFELQSDGTILAFYQYFSIQILRKLNADGSVNTTFSDHLFKGWDAVVQPNGKVIVAGDDNDVFGQSFDLNRYNTDGTHDPSGNRFSFSSQSTFHFPRALELQSDGKVIVGGSFTSYTLNSGGPSVSRPYLARFTPQAIPVRPKYDFDGDGKDDVAVFRPSNGQWYVHQSTGGYTYSLFGISTDKPIVNDYDGDGRADIAVFRDGVWHWLRSSNGVYAYRLCGQAGDIPTPSYGPSGRADFYIFRPPAASFFDQQPYQPQAQPYEFRNMTLQSGDKPVIADYDGDGRDDLAVFRNGDWYYMTSNGLETRHFLFGQPGDIPVPADYDGDLRTDLAVFRPSSGIWYIYKSADGFYGAQWGMAGDIPVPADYDGDGKVDIAVFRPSTGVWYQLLSNNTVTTDLFGTSGDIPAQVR